MRWSPRTRGWRCLRPRERASSSGHRGRGDRQRDDEPRSRAAIAIGVDDVHPAPMLLHQPAYDGEADAGPADRAARIPFHPIIRREDPLAFVHGYARTFVGHLE